MLHFHDLLKVVENIIVPVIHMPTRVVEYYSSPGILHARPMSSVILQFLLGRIPFPHGAYSRCRARSHWCDMQLEPCAMYYYMYVTDSILPVPGTDDTEARRCTGGGMAKAWLPETFNIILRVGSGLRVVSDLNWYQKPRPIVGRCQ
jgi:hypothetical protein